MRHHRDIAARDELRDDARLPEGLHARQRLLERFGGRQQRRVDLRVARVEARVARVVGVERRRRDVVAAAPDLHLRLAVARHGLGLVESLQRAVVAFVEPPAALHRDPHPVHGVEHDPEGADGALEHRGVGDVHRDAGGEQFAAGARGLRAALFREVDIGPAREQVIDVPDALAMTDEDEFADGHRGLPGGARSGRRES